MKQIVTLKKQRLLFTLTVVLGLVAVLFPTKTFAQHEQLLDRTWYVNKLVIEGITYDYLTLEIRNGDESRIIMEIWNTEGFLMHDGCPGWGCIGIFDFVENENKFILNDGGCLASSPCDHYGYNGDDIENYILFADKHDYFLFRRIDLLLAYEIQNNDGIDYLTFTDENGDSIVYTSENLSVPDIKDLKISLAPNPVRDLLVVRLEHSFSPMKMEIIDLQGRKMQQLDIHNRETQIDVSRYSAGVYVIKLTDQSGKQQTSRFVKL